MTDVALELQGGLLRAEGMVAIQMITSKLSLSRLQGRQETIKGPLAFAAGVIRIGDFPRIDVHPAAKASSPERYQRSLHVDVPIAAWEVFGRAAVATRAIGVSEVHIADVLDADPFIRSKWLGS